MNTNIDALLSRPYFTTAEAEAAGVSRRMLSYYAKKGTIYRVKSGIYSSQGYEGETSELEWLDLAIAANSIKGGVVCLISALAYYGLTDEIMDTFWIAVKNSDSKRRFPNCNIVRMRDVETGSTEINIAGMSVMIFDRERTIVDSFRMLDEETAIKSLKSYMRQKPDIDKICRYAKKMRTTKIIDHIKVLMV